MNYNLYTAEDFASDESFINYYLKSNQDDIDFWTQWISCNPEKLDEVLTAERLLDMLYLHLPEHELDIELNKFESFLKEKEVQPESLLKTSPLKFSVNGVYVVLLLLILVPTLFIGVKRFTKAKEIAQTYITKHNEFGQRSIIQLSDGTKITLNANSTIKYPKAFGAIRNVELEGEAYFEVMKNPKKPFIVHAGSFTTQVLGTSFNMNTRLEPEKIEVALVEGSVKVNDQLSGNHLTLKPHEKVVFDKVSKKLLKANFDTESLTAWKDGIIKFKNASFNEIAKEMYATYGITIINLSKHKNWKYTGEFKNTDYISIMKSICFSENLVYKQLNDTLYINHINAK
jgi:ferric-dicitrate binding protein FerR (iron transport regulator)